MRGRAHRARLERLASLRADELSTFLSAGKLDDPPLGWFVETLAGLGLLVILFLGLLILAFCF